MRGRSKLAFEKALVEGWDRCVVFPHVQRCWTLAPYDKSASSRSGFVGILRDKGTVELWRDEVRSFVAMRQVRDGVKGHEEYGVKHGAADDHEARALEAAALSPSETARFHHRARALRPAVLHSNLRRGAAPLSRRAVRRAVASAAALDALVRGALRPARDRCPKVARVGLVSAACRRRGVPLVPSGFGACGLARGAALDVAVLCLRAPPRSRLGTCRRRGANGDSRMHSRDSSAAGACRAS